LHSEFKDGQAFGQTLIFVGVNGRINLSVRVMVRVWGSEREREREREVIIVKI
jgi:hypothetical protein